MKKQKNIKLLKSEDNRNGNLPVFTRKYSADVVTQSLHMHEYMQINYISHGRGRHLVNNHEFDIVKGDIFVIPPYVPHRIIAVEYSDIEVYELEFTSDLINLNFVNIENAMSFLDFAYIEPFLVSENKVKPRLNLIGNTRNQIEVMLEEALKEYSERAPGFLLLIKSIILKLLVLVGREFTRDLEDESLKENSVFIRNRDAILSAVNYINEHFDYDLNIGDVSHKFALSQSYFSYLFKAITSKTFTEYLSGIRISKAMELLKSTDNRV